MSLTLDSACELDPRVALRPEPFGALAYHYGNRRLVFLRHPDIVSVVADLGGHDSVRDALEARGGATERWASFLSALESLRRSEILRVR